MIAWLRWLFTAAPSTNPADIRRAAHEAVVDGWKARRRGACSTWEMQNPRPTPYGEA